MQQLVQNHNYTMSIPLILKQSAIYCFCTYTFSLHSPQTLRLQKKAAAQNHYNKNSMNLIQISKVCSAINNTFT